MAKITVYSTQACPYCVMAKDFFKEKNIDFTELDVSVDQAKAEEMMEKSGQMGVPVIIIEADGKEEIITGFDKEKITQVLGL